MTSSGDYQPKATNMADENEAVAVAEEVAEVAETPETAAETTEAAPAEAVGE